MGTGFRGVVLTLLGETTCSPEIGIVDPRFTVATLFGLRQGGDATVGTHDFNRIHRTVTAAGYTGRRTRTR